MNDCTVCQIKTPHHVCPICQHELTSDPHSESLYPEVQTTLRKNSKKKIIFFIMISMLAISIFINFTVSTTVLWSLYVLGSVFYAIILINHTFLSEAHSGSKVLLQLCGLSLMLIIFDINSGFYRWSINYVVPFFGIMAITVITFFLLRNPNDLKIYFKYYFFLLLINLVLVGLVSSSLYSTVQWPSAMFLFYSTFILGGIVFFSYRKMKVELKRFFHF